MSKRARTSDAERRLAQRDVEDYFALKSSARTSDAERRLALVLVLIIDFEGLCRVCENL